MENKMNCGVYKITSPTGRIYIGSSNNLKSRESNYKRGADEAQVKIYNSVKKYGWDNHTFEIVLICDPKDRC